MGGSFFLSCGAGDGVALGHELTSEALKPIAQAQRRFAVFSIVVLDRRQYSRQGVTGVASTRKLEKPTRPSRFPQVRFAREVMKLFELLKRVFLDSGAQPLLDDRQQIAKHLLTQEVINVIFPTRVASRKLAECGLLGWREVVDVEFGVVLPTPLNVRNKAFKVEPLLTAVPSPEPFKPGLTRPVQLDPTEQVDEVTVGRVAITLDVEENVARRRHRQATQTLALNDGCQDSQRRLLLCQLQLQVSLVLQLHQPLLP